MTRQTLVPFCLSLLLTAAPALAQTDRAAGWLDLIAPDRIVAGLIQSGIVGLRTQVELRHDAMRVDVAGGTVALSGVHMRPLPHLFMPEGCEMAVDRVVLSGLTPFVLTRLAPRAEVIGLRVAAACLPDLAVPLAAVGIDRVVLDRALIALDYDLASGAADLSVFADMPGLGSVAGQARLDYLAFGEGRSGDVEPVVRLRDAQVTLEEAGALAKLQPFLPPELRDPARAAATFRAQVQSEMERANSRSERRARERRGEDPNAVFEAPLTPEQVVFLDSATREMARFLQGGTQVTLTLTGQPGALLDFRAMEVDGRVAIAALNPVLRAGPPARAGLVSVALLQTAMTAPDSLTPADRLRVGQAALTGLGMPRDLGLGRSLMEPLATAGDGRAALTLAGSLERADPAVAYRFALIAGQAGAPGAVALLDRIETGLDMPSVLQVQAGITGAAREDGMESLAAMRRAALGRLIGNGVARSYAEAWFWASLAAAAGDAAGASLRDQIEAQMAALAPEGRAAWAAAVAPEQAMLIEVWTTRNLPAVLAVE